MIAFDNRSKLASEIKIHQSLDNPNVVKFINVFEDRKNVYILLEYCKNQVAILKIYLSNRPPSISILLSYNDETVFDPIM